jgi:hypothetical protein
VFTNRFFPEGISAADCSVVRFVHYITEMIESTELGVDQNGRVLGHSVLFAPSAMVSGTDRLSDTPQLRTAFERRDADVRSMEAKPAVKLADAAAGRNLGVRVQAVQTFCLKTEGK